MRRKGLIIVGIFVGLFIVLSYIFTDFWFEYQLEKLGRGIVGAKVEIENLDLSLLKLSVTWDSLQIANPKDTWTNVLTTGLCQFDIGLGPLLKKKFVIENFSAQNLNSGTKRTTDGKVEQKPPKKKPTFLTHAIQDLQEKIKETPEWQFSQNIVHLNVDSLINLMNLKTPEKMDSLQSSLNVTYDNWKNLDSLHLKKQLSELNKEIKSLKIEKVDNIAKLEKTISTVQTIKNELDSLRLVINTRKDSLFNDLNHLQLQMAQIDDWLEEDYERALRMAHLPTLNKRNIALFIFGEKIVNRVTRFLNIVDQIRYHTSKFESKKPEKEKPQRLKGQTIHFPEKNVLPKYWIKQIKITGTTYKGIKVSGTVNDIVSNQKQINKITEINIQGKRMDNTMLEFTGELDYLQKPRESFRLKMTQIPIDTLRIESKIFPVNIQQGKADITAGINIGENSFNSDIQFSGQNLDIEPFGKSENQMEKVVRSFVKNLNIIEFQSKIKNVEGQTDLEIQSNLDQIFMDEMEKIVGSQIFKTTQKIKSEINERVKEQRNRLENLQSRNNQLKTVINEYDQLLNQNTELLGQAREKIEQRIEQEKEKQQDQLLDQLEGLF